MIESVLSALRRGLGKLTGNPQLFYTAIVALIIVGAFIFVAERFVSIANDAQERLVNVRVGSLQDAFVSFAGDRMNDSDYLNARITDVMAANETIQTFDVVRKMTPEELASSTLRTPYVVVASGDQQRVGTGGDNVAFLYDLAESDSSHSLTMEFFVQGERVFRTARAIVGEEGEVRGVAVTTQTLSEADRAIATSIQTSIVVLVVVLLVIVLLFLRYSKVIDYMELYRRLKEVDQLKDDFISMASHELRTPLTVIRGYAEYIREAPELLPETRAYATHIDTSAKGLDALVGDILDVSRIEQGRMTFALQTVATLPLVAEAVESFQLPAKEKKLILVLDRSRAHEEQKSTVDPDRFKQVLTNLIGNAIKYTPQGSITVQQYVEGNRLYIRVSDTGIGMSAEAQKHLFEKFYRIRSEETQHITGTGLGLWITAQIVRQMNGVLTVESIKGVGSHFIVSFPLST